MAIDTIPARLFTSAERLGSRPAYYEKVAGTYTPTSWTDYGDQVSRAARSLIAMGFQGEENVAILGFNRPEWVIMDVAAIAAGGAAAGIYTTCSPEEVQYIIGHCEAPIVLLENQEQWAKVLEQLDNLPKLKHVVMMKDAGPIDHELVMTWDDFMAKGADLGHDKVEERLEGCTEEQTATFIYTSGTTGPPKAVMLTHKNLTWTSGAASTIAEVGQEDSSVSYLPLSHIAEQMFTIHVPITVGSTVYFAESIKLVAENLKEVQPTIVFGVPRIWEKMHAKVSAKLAGATGMKKKLVDFAMRTGREVVDLRNRGKEPSGFLGIKYKIANKLIFSKVKPLMGLSKANMCVSGAAPIAPEILEFFAHLDLVIHEVYGQSEDSGPTTFNLKGHTRYGTVGTTLAGTEVKIADDGEICVRGPHVFKGYYKDEAATKECLIDGWLHSGDLGKFDSEGFLSITGRKKEIIITAGGKNIAPKNIESAIKNCPQVAQAVVIGDRRKFLSALITLDAEFFGYDPIEAAEQDLLAKHAADKAVIAEVQKWVDTNVNPKFAQVEHVRKFTVLSRDFSVEKKELTPTLKIKRRIINANFEAEIEAMYGETAKASA
jgi:long-chain acyl-CoA synthetase